MVHLASSLIVLWFVVMVLNGLGRWNDARHHGKRLRALYARLEQASDGGTKAELRRQIEHEEQMIDIIESRSNNPFD